MRAANALVTVACVLALACSTPSRTEPRSAASAPAVTRSELLDRVTALQQAARGAGDLSSIVRDGRGIQVGFACVMPPDGPTNPGVNLVRERLLEMLARVAVSDEPSCGEATRCCTFTRDPAAPREAASLASVCFDADLQLRNLTIVDQDACYG